MMSNRLPGACGNLKGYKADKIILGHYDHLISTSRSDIGKKSHNQMYARTEHSVSKPSINNESPCVKLLSIARLSSLCDVYLNQAEQHSAQYSRCLIAETSESAGEKKTTINTS